jgi:hypothetical protein
MIEEPKGASPVGRPRRMIGLIVLVLGILILARDLWLGLSYGSGFGPEERIRFVAWLWASVVLILFGCWLIFRSRAAAWALLVAVASLAVLA